MSWTIFPQKDRPVTEFGEKMAAAIHNDKRGLIKKGTNLNAGQRESRAYAREGIQIMVCLYDASELEKKLVVGLWFTVA